MHSTAGTCQVPGLEERVVSAIPWDQPRERAASVPRLAGVFAATIALLLVAVLAAPTILSRLNIQIPGFTSGSEAPAYSLAAVTGGSVFVVQRSAGNVLLQSSDGGRTWTDRLHFGGIYDGTQIFGADGFIWSIDMQPGECMTTSDSGRSCAAPSYTLMLYRTVDGGTSWTALPVPAFPASDAFFLDASRGWVVSSSPMTGFGSEMLFTTVDGGASWAPVGALPQSSPMGQVYGVGNYRVTFSRQGDGSVRMVRGRYAAIFQRQRRPILATCGDHCAGFSRRLDSHPDPTCICRSRGNPPGRISRSDRPR